MTVAAVGTAVSFSLVWASTHGLRPLWTVGLSTAAIACLANLVLPFIELYSYDCGSLCGETWALRPVGIAISSIATAAILSSTAIRKRRVICAVVGWVISTISLVAGLSHGIS